MADYIEVNIQTLEQDIEEMKELVKSIRGDMKSMFQSVEELDAMWQGVAHDEFIKQLMLDGQIFADVCEAIDEIIDSASKAVVSYRNCESAIGEEIKRIKV